MSKIIKTCTCGMGYTKEEWEELPYVGEMADEVEALEMRSCPCQTTISIPLRSYRYDVKLDWMLTEHYASSFYRLFENLSKSRSIPEHIVNFTATRTYS
jgi:hypothetical protein